MAGLVAQVVECLHEALSSSPSTTKKEKREKKKKDKCKTWARIPWISPYERKTLVLSEWRETYLRAQSCL
jgi:hypothetical protein